MSFALERETDPNDMTKSPDLTNIKVTKSEIWVSLLGILTLIVVISSIAYVQH